MNDLFIVSDTFLLLSNRFELARQNDFDN